MKTGRLLSLLTAFLLALSLTACGAAQSGTEADPAAEDVSSGTDTALSDDTAEPASGADTQTADAAAEEEPEQPEAEPEPEAESDTESDTDTAQSETGTASEDRAALISAYQDALNTFYLYQEFPGDTEPRDFSGNPEENYFAVCDIDGDGADELILQYNTGSSAAQGEAIYGYDPESAALRLELSEYPLLTYYDNNTICAHWSHNQGLAGNFWPYNVYQYDAESDSYQLLGSVDAWDSSCFETDFDGNAFPSDIDVSGTGIVYYLLAPDSTETPDPVDAADYNAWVESWQQDAVGLEIPYQALTPEAIEQLS